MHVGAVLGGESGVCSGQMGGLRGSASRVQMPSPFLAREPRPPLPGTRTSFQQDGDGVVSSCDEPAFPKELL